MAVIFGPDTFTVGADIDIDDYPSGDPDYAYSRGSGSNCQVIAADDNVQTPTTGVDVVVRVIDAAIPANMGDQEVRATVQGRFSSGGAFGCPAVRYSATTRGYISQLALNNVNEVRILEDNAGFTLLASADRSLAPLTPYTAEFRATGSSTTSLSLIIGGTAAVTFDDTSAAETGSPAFHTWRSATSGGSQNESFLDDLEVDDLDSGGTAAVRPRLFTMLGVGA